MAYSVPVIAVTAFLAAAAAAAFTLLVPRIRMSVRPGDGARGDSPLKMVTRRTPGAGTIRTAPPSATARTGSRAPSPARQFPAAEGRRQVTAMTTRN